LFHGQRGRETHTSDLFVLGRDMPACTSTGTNVGPWIKKTADMAKKTKPKPIKLLKGGITFLKFKGAG
jgi:hypothetical protein